ncbi:hypothetical protein J437_LFUL018028, partial [Ladona fulva]
MAPPVARKNLEAENAELWKMLEGMEELKAFKWELTEAKAESPKSNKVSSIKERFISFERNVTNAISSIMRRSDQLEEQMDALEQYSKRNGLFVHGIQESPKENCIEQAVALYRDKLNVSVDASRIDQAHRVGAPRSDNKPRPFIVKFISYQDRKKVWTAKKSLKGSGILITESLTAARNE